MILIDPTPQAMKRGIKDNLFVATLPEARGRGIGAALTLAPLLDARQLGYRVGILQSSEMGYRIYARMGSQRLTPIDHFYYKQGGL